MPTVDGGGCVFGESWQSFEKIEAKKQKSPYGLIPSYRRHSKFHKLRLSTTQDMEDPECQPNKTEDGNCERLCARGAFFENHGRSDKKIEAKKQKSRYVLIPSYRRHLKFHKLRFSTTQNREDPECQPKKQKMTIASVCVCEMRCWRITAELKISKPKSRNLDMF